jgi:Ca2+-binding RTX toxin-like protein
VSATLSGDRDSRASRERVDDGGYRRIEWVAGYGGVDGCPRHTHRRAERTPRTVGDLDPRLGDGVRDGDAGNDTLNGGVGLYGNANDDTMWGDAGDDYFGADSTNDGNDTILQNCETT